MTNVVQPIRSVLSSIRSTLEPTLNILDEGLRIYRRGFSLFLTFTAVWIVPLAIGLGVGISLDQSWLIIVALLVAAPLAIYLIGVLSRVTLEVQQAQSPAFRSMLAVSPLRLASMGCYSLVFLMVVNTLASMIGLIWFCGGFGLLAFFIGGFGAAIDGGPIGTGLAVLMSFLLVMLIVLFYAFNLMITGIVYGSLIYGLQPFVQHRVNLGQNIELSVNLIFYRFWANVLTFSVSSLIFGATAVATTTAIVVLLPLPLSLVLGEDAPLVQGISVCAWIIGLIVVLPPMPIWMALLYQRNYRAREGLDLATRIDASLGEGVVT